jgi:hypothetical protein
MQPPKAARVLGALENVRQASELGRIHARERDGKLREGRRAAVCSVHLLVEAVSVSNGELGSKLAEDDEQLFGVDFAAATHIASARLRMGDSRISKAAAQFVIRVDVGKRLGHLQQNAREGLARDLLLKHGCCKLMGVHLKVRAERLSHAKAVQPEERHAP